MRAVDGFHARWAFSGLALLGSFAFVACSGKVTQDAGCVYGGTRYELGASFSSADGCNTCACTESSTVGCTGDGGVRCAVGERSYAPGEQVPNDGCDTCQCTPTGDVVCTARDCPLMAPNRCDSLREQTALELARVQTCNIAADCGQPIPGSSCGCTRDLVARKDADLSTYQALRSELTSRCTADGGSCDCPSAVGFVCDNHICAWNYTPEPKPDPKPDPACRSLAPAGLCVHGTPTADGQLLSVGDPLRLTVFSDGCFSSSCSQVQVASCSVTADDAFQVQASFCVTDTSARQLACTADCAVAHADCSFGQPLTSGEHRVNLGGVTVSFQVPSTLPFGGLCAGLDW